MNTSWLLPRMMRIAANRRPDFIIGGSDAPYLRRWWIIPRNRLFNIYLHCFHRDDDDRALHDHPWVNLSLLLSGQYVEIRIRAGGVQERTERSAGALIARWPWTAHRIELVNGQPCWTLFITGPVMRVWGFHCPAGWRPWKQYVDGRDKGSIGIGCD